jgi:2-C-methyl-D-erythritol 4-phosphate cytidylyltransferase
MTQFHVIIVAGGSGQRMGASVPKQFLMLQKKPVLMHTIERFAFAMNGIHIILVLPENHHTTWNSLVIEHKFQIKHTLTTGGKTRFESVKNGLKLVSNGIVGVHDGVRPLVSELTIQRCFETASKLGNAVPVIDVNDSLRIIKEDSNSQAVDRTKFRIVQTPQCFKVAEMKQAFEQEYSTAFTDCASVMEAAGNIIHLTAGNTENIKITQPSDLVLAEALLKDY